MNRIMQSLSSRVQSLSPITRKIAIIGTPFVRPLETETVLAAEVVVDLEVLLLAIGIVDRTGTGDADRSVR